MRRLPAVIRRVVLLGAALSGAIALVAGSSMASAQAVATAAAAAAAPVAATRTTEAVPDYRLGAGDVLHLTVYQNPDLSLDVRLSDSGFISYPLLGAVHVGGLTVPQAEQLIADGLKKGDFVKSPQVTAVLMQVRGSQVSVLGQVNRPGRYPLEQAETRLSDVLALAGGIIASAGSDTVVIEGTRDGKPMRAEVDLPKVFEAADRRGDLVLRADDVVWVARAPIVYIYGEVQRPGPFRLERNMTLLQGLASGGGLTQRGTEKGIRIHRRAADGHVEMIQPNMDATLQDGDVIYVRESLF
jgi:polysaccharide export outer membrane protein